jgi:hypothetical protein
MLNRLLIILIGIAFVGCGPGSLSNEEFAKELNTDKEELLSDLLILIDFSKLYCPKGADLEYHVNQDKLFLHSCSGNVSDSVKAEVYELMKRRDVDYVISREEGIFFSFLKARTFFGKYRPNNTYLLYSDGFTEERYSLVEKFDENWFLVERHKDGVEYIITD